MVNKWLNETASTSANHSSIKESDPFGIGLIVNAGINSHKTINKTMNKTNGFFIFFLKFFELKDIGFFIHFNLSSKVLLKLYSRDADDRTMNQRKTKRTLVSNFLNVR